VVRSISTWYGAVRRYEGHSATSRPGPRAASSQIRRLARASAESGLSAGYRSIRQAAKFDACSCLKRFPASLFLPAPAPGRQAAGASSVVVASNGDIFVGDGHGGNTNDRVVKFDKTGKQILTWGKHGKGQGEFDQLHGIAMDSQGRIFVADRGNSRIQIFDSNGKFVAEWKQFGRPSDVAIDKNDVIYAADDQSNQTNNPGFKTGIRIGSAKDGKVTAFIPTPSAEIATPEGVGFDDAGNVYGSWTGKMAVRRWTKS
jgi:NHL repeat